MQPGSVIMFESIYTEHKTETNANFHWFCAHVIGISLGLDLGIGQYK